MKRAVDTGHVMMDFASDTHYFDTEWLNALSRVQKHQTDKNVRDMASANYLVAPQDACVKLDGVAKCAIYLVRVSPTAESLAMGMEIA